MPRLFFLLLPFALWLIPASPLPAASPDARSAQEARPIPSRDLPLAPGELPPLPPEIDSNDVDTNNYPVDSFLTDWVIPGLTLLISVPIHELGHYGMATGLGSESVEIVFFPKGGGIIPTIAATSVDTRGLSKFDIGLIAISGVGATRLTAEALHLLARGFDSRMTYPTFAQRLTSAVFIFGRMDFPIYLVTDMVTNLGQSPGGDMDILVTQIAGRATWPRVGTYLGLLGVAALDLYLDLDRIGYHYSIFNGKQVPHPATWSSLRIGVLPGAGMLGARYSITF